MIHAINRMVFHEDWYDNSQLKDLAMLASKVKHLEGSLIEIGCWEGKSTHILANTCYPETLICNDTWKGNVAESQCTGETHVTIKILQERDVYQTFIDNMNTLTKQNYQVVKADCLEWLPTLNKKIKFCHIDASHEYESVYKTIELVKPHMVAGGIICGDDFATANKEQSTLYGGVEKAVIDHFPNVKTLSNGNLWYWVKPHLMIPNYHSML